MQVNTMEALHCQRSHCQTRGYRLSLGLERPASEANEISRQGGDMSDDHGNDSGDSGVIPGLPPQPHRGWTFDEQPVGKRWTTNRRTITETDLVVYATQFGFGEGLFLDATAARLTSRGDRGIVTTRNEVFNQHGNLVMVYSPTRMILCRHTDD